MDGVIGISSYANSLVRRTPSGRVHATGLEVACTCGNRNEFVEQIDHGARPTLQCRAIDPKRWLQFIVFDRWRR